MWWVYRNACAASIFSQVIIATDDRRISSTCKKFKMPVIMTSHAHPTGTDRAAEVAKKIKADIYVNLQGDEPFITPGMMKKVITPFIQNASCVQVTNLMTKIRRTSDLANATIPKVVVNARGEAIFFSRAPIPYPKNPSHALYYKQVCVYGFLPQTLFRFSQLPRGHIELIEDIEILRFIENDIPVQMAEVGSDTVAVDTSADLELVRSIFSRKKKAR